MSGDHTSRPSIYFVSSSSAFICIESSFFLSRVKKLVKLSSVAKKDRLATDESLILFKKNGPDFVGFIRGRSFSGQRHLCPAWTKIFGQRWVKNSLNSLHSCFFSQRGEVVADNFQTVLESESIAQFVAWFLVLCVGIIPVLYRALCCCDK